MPQLRLASWSILLLHGNELSCKLPSLGHVTPSLVIALLGNHFRAPRSYPAWIKEFERGAHLVVSNWNAVTLLLKVLGGGFAFILVVFHVERRKEQKQVRASMNLYGRFALVHALLHRSLSGHTAGLCLGCVAVLAYLRGHHYACFTLLTMLRIPVLSGSLYGFTTMWEIICAAYIYALFSRFFQKLPLPFANRKRSTGRKNRNGQPHCMPLRADTGKAKTMRAWAKWLTVCVCVSSPGASYAMLKTIPGFLRSSPVLDRLVTYSVSLCTSFVTVLCLPSLAHAFKRSCSSLSRMELLSFANFLALPLIPGLINFVCHANCFGQWARFWQPCNQRPSPLEAMEHLRVPFYVQSFADHVTVEDSFYNLELLKQQDVCGQGRMSSGKCADAMIARSTEVLLNTAVHLTFTATVARMLMSRRMKVQAALVHLVRMWTLVLIFGSALPLLLFIAVMNFLVYKWLLFGKPAQLQDDAGDSESNDDQAMVALPKISIRLALLCSCLLQFSLVFAGSSRDAWV